MFPADLKRDRGPASGRAPLDPQSLRVQAERERRWRAFPDQLSKRGFDWSRTRARRPEGYRSRWRALRARGEEARVLEAGGPPDTVRVAFIRIAFLTDRGGGKSTGDGHFDLSGPDTLAPPIDRPPHNRTFYLSHHEALSRFYKAQSYDRTVIVGDVWPRSENGAYFVSDMADMAPPEGWKFSQDIYPAAVKMLRTMMFAADSQSIVFHDRIPWHQYDRFVVIHAGSDFQNDVHGDSPEDIPSFTLGVSDSDRVIFPDSVKSCPPDPHDPLAEYCPIDRASFVPETITQDGFYGAINGVMAHECGHLIFGFVDVYDVDNGFPVVGFWSLMDSGNLVGSIVVLPDQTELFATGLLPPSVDPWQRQFTTDTLHFREVSYGDTLTLRAGERYPDMRRVTLSSDEYLILENRYLAPASAISLDQDSTTHVILGPKNPDRFEYDALLPGGGVLVWHIDESVIPNEVTFPCDSARANHDCGVNTDPRRLGISVIEADGLADLGDPGSPFLLGSRFDPFFYGNNALLSDTSEPNLIPHIGTRPHIQINFLPASFRPTEPDSIMPVSALRSWQLPGWPIAADVPPGGPELLAVDADGSDRKLEVCWAGGGAQSADSTALFAVRVNGQGLNGSSYVFARLDRRPRPVMAALSLGDQVGSGQPNDGPSLFAVSTYAAGPDTSMAGGRAWLVDHHGVPQPGWPPPLPSIVTTPPLIEGSYPNAHVYVGCADGHVYALALDGTVIASSDRPLPGGVRGRLAIVSSVIIGPGGGGGPPLGPALVAAGGANGEVGVFNARGDSLVAMAGWPQRIGTPGFEPDFLWLNFGGAGAFGTDCLAGALSLAVHDRNHLWAFCASGQPLPGWGRDLPDTLVAGLGAGDPDGDGFPEVLTQSTNSKITFWNVTGYPSPGWPKRATTEGFVTESSPLALDLDGDGRSEVVAMNASGILAGLRYDGKEPQGWPLASGLGAKGSLVAADLDRDGSLEVIAPDRSGRLYAYSVPTSAFQPRASSWTVLGGDPGRSSALPIDRTPTPPAAAIGPLVKGSLKAFPNPARRRPVSFAYQLTEPAEVEFRILDTSGHEVASFTRRGRQADNLEVWEPGALPAGLYVARLRFHGTGPERVEMIPVGLIR